MAVTTEKARAHRMVSDAVKAGKLTPGPCSFCGTCGNIVGHHVNYAHPLEVEWICRSHHGQLHRHLRYYQEKWR